jgi:hypothetical protein
MLQSRFDTYVKVNLLFRLGIQFPTLRPPNLRCENSQRSLPDKTKYSQATDIHVTTGIRIRNLSIRPEADTLLSWRSQRDRRRII